MIPGLSSSLMVLFKVINPMVGNIDFFFINAQLLFNHVQPFNCIVVKVNLVCQLIQFVFDQCDGCVVLLFCCLALHNVVDHADQDGNSTSDYCFNHFPSVPLLTILNKCNEKSAMLWLAQKHCL